MNKLLESLYYSVTLVVYQISLFALTYQLIHSSGWWSVVLCICVIVMFTMSLFACVRLLGIEK